MLTREEARQLVLTRLKARQDAQEHFVEEDRTVERPFGWLFFVAVPGSSATAQAETISYRLIIVNKHVEQLIESSIDYTPERFIEVYETLLPKVKQHKKTGLLRFHFRLIGELSARDGLQRRQKS